VIVEAAEKSGSLITARMALEQDRQVFAVPGSPLSGKTRGSNRLLREGAVLVECVEDVIEDLAPQMAGKASAPAQPAAAASQAALAVAAPVQVRTESPAMQPSASGAATEVSEPSIKWSKSSEPSIISSRSPSESLVGEKSKEIQSVLNCLIDAQKLHVDAVIESCQLPPQTVLNLLLELELRGLVVQHPGKLFTLP
jgi:DNA processing protein